MVQRGVWGGGARGWRGGGWSCAYTPSSSDRRCSISARVDPVGVGDCAVCGDGFHMNKKHLEKLSRAQHIEIKSMLTREQLPERVGCGVRGYPVYLLSVFNGNVLAMGLALMWQARPVYFRARSIEPASHRNCGKQ